MSSKTPKKEDDSEAMLYVAPKVEESYNPADWTSYYEESTKDRFKRKALENPFIPTGAMLTAGTTGAG